MYLCVHVCRVYYIIPEQRGTWQKHRPTQFFCGIMMDVNALCLKKQMVSVVCSHTSCWAFVLCWVMNWYSDKEDVKRGDGDVDILSVAETKQKKAFCRKFPEFPVGNFFLCWYPNRICILKLNCFSWTMDGLECATSCLAVFQDFFFFICPFPVSSGRSVLWGVKGGVTADQCLGCNRGIKRVISVTYCVYYCCGVDLSRLLIQMYWFIHTLSYTHTLFLCFVSSVYKALLHSVTP